MSKPVVPEEILTKYIKNDNSADGVDRRGFLQCMAWAGTGVLWALKGGVLSSVVMDPQGTSKMSGAELMFVQVSDSHIGFDKPANPDVAATLGECVKRINALPTAPAFLLHTGDISHLSKPSEFDTAEQLLKGAKAGRTYYVPGEHDFIGDNGKMYLDRYGKGTQGSGWYSFDYNGAHFIGLVNVANLKAGGMGSLGPEQLEWLEKDLKGKSTSTPIIIFAHIPLWSVYPEWGWGTDDSAQALSYVKRFGSVSVAFTGTDESPRGATAQRAGNHPGKFCARATHVGHCGHSAGGRRDDERDGHVSRQGHERHENVVGQRKDGRRRQVRRSSEQAGRE
jgi:Icc protein